MKLTSTRYLMREHHSKVVMKENIRISDCAIIMAECLVVRVAIRKVSQKGIQWIIIQTDSQLTVNSINRKISVL